MKNSNIISILVIDNNSDEVNLIAKIIDIKKWNVNFNSLNDGVEAMDYLHKKGKYKNCATPSLILLDLNLPNKTGIEVLKEIKTNSTLKYIPVIVLTTSNNDKDIFKSYEYHANAFITKPLDSYKFKEDMSILKEFWFNNVQLPNTEN